MTVLVLLDQCGTETLNTELNRPSDKESGKIIDACNSIIENQKENKPTIVKPKRKLSTLDKKMKRTLEFNPKK